MDTKHSPFNDKTVAGEGVRRKIREFLCFIREIFKREGSLKFSLSSKVHKSARNRCLRPILTTKYPLSLTKFR